MATKVDSTSAVEARLGQSTVSMSASSTVSASSPKVSMFGKKSGFVIPKNKLSGSLVPIFRGRKVESGNNVKEENTKQVQRKTKWGTDLTQDAAVRKGRALAYQTRVEQITQQLKSGALDIGDDQDSHSPKQESSNSSSHNVDVQVQKFKLLELERREIIGEILRLNPSYKVPADYKPLLKEGKVPIPLKAHPGYNFIGLLLGPESNTQKRLEEETGTKIRVYGTKVNTGEKHEITQSDTSETQSAYKELYVNVSADTYEKVDAAVALIELLVTSVSGNLAVPAKESTSVAADNASIYDQNTSASGYMMTPMADVNQGVVQPILMPVQSVQPQFQSYSSPWFPVAPPNTLSHPPPGYMPQHLANNSLRFPPSVRPMNMPPYFGQPPFGSAPRTSSPVGSRPLFPMQSAHQPLQNQAVQPQNIHPMPGQQPPPAFHAMPPQSGTSAPASQPVLTGMMPPTRPLAPVNPQPGSMARPLATPSPSGNSPGWSAPQQNTTPPLRPNITPMAPPSINPPVRPQQSLTPQQNVSNNLARPQPASFAPFPPGPSGAPPSFTSAPPQIGPISVPPMISSSGGAPLQRPTPPMTSMPPAAPSSAPGPLPMPAAPSAPILLPHAVSQTTPLPNASIMPSQSVAPSINRPTAAILSLSPGQAPRPAHPSVQSPQPPAAVVGSSSSSMPSFSTVKPDSTSSITIPPITAPKPLRPSSGDFTFQPLRAQVPASPATPRPSGASVVQNIAVVPLAAPQAPSFRPALQNLAPSLGTQGFPQPSAMNKLLPAQPSLQPSLSGAFPTNSTIARAPLRFPLPNANPVPSMAPANQVTPPSFSPAPQAPNLSSFTMPSQPGNLLQHQNQLPPGNRPSSIVIPNQQLASNPPGYMVGKVPPTPGGNQSYDPFSPTSISSSPLQQGGEPVKVRKPETDAEYEDLMASVGVK